MQTRTDVDAVEIVVEWTPKVMFYEVADGERNEGTEVTADVLDHNGATIDPLSIRFRFTAEAFDLAMTDERKCVKREVDGVMNDLVAYINQNPYHGQVWRAVHSTFWHYNPRFPSRLARLLDPDRRLP